MEEAIRDRRYSTFLKAGAAAMPLSELQELRDEPEATQLRLLD